MKMNEEVIFTDQLLHHRCVGSQIEKTRDTWEKQCSWFVNAQNSFYNRYAEIYAECLDKYGNDNFEYYARRNRLREDFLIYTETEIERRRRDSEISMEHMKNCRASRTTNGEYGRVNL
ncbi:uncharacterized protein LOC110184930 [Drosophila serrata]|uniref:uncharacterized protein LOC110184930 n=1 Tax=Drosophila serrata TaxID=7274 RepID=UPI000A1D2EC1|nr:uncharacterized protein LOC110184930 [Drosophila serrata]